MNSWPRTILVLPLRPLLLDFVGQSSVMRGISLNCLRQFGCSVRLKCEVKESGEVKNCLELTVKVLLLKLKVTLILFEKDIMPLIDVGERRRKRKRLMIFLEWTREGHSKSDEHWNCLNGNFGETSERWDGVLAPSSWTFFKHCMIVTFTDTVMNVLVNLYNFCFQPVRKPLLLELSYPDSVQLQVRSFIWSFAL